MNDMSPLAAAILTDYAETEPTPFLVLALKIAAGDMSGLPRHEHLLFEVADWQSAADEALNEDNPFELDWMLAREECWQRFNTMTLPEDYDFDSFIDDRAAWNGDDTVFARARRLPAVSRPVDCSDAEQFPEIATAIEHARKQRMGAQHG